VDGEDRLLLMDTADERRELLMKKSIQTIAATALCALVLSVLATPMAQGDPAIVGGWNAGPAWDVQVVSGDQGAALECARLFSWSQHTYWEDGSWWIRHGLLSITCPPEDVVTRENAIHIQGQIPDGMFAGTLVTGKATYRDAYWWDMEIHLVKGEPGAGGNGTAPAFEIAFQLELQTDWRYRYP
jgi:hypothetical protein